MAGEGPPPALPSPSCCWGGDVGSCSAKPWSFSPLKPDYSGGACACVHACVLGRGGGGISQQQVFAATLGPAAPDAPEGLWRCCFCREEPSRGGSPSTSAGAAVPVVAVWAEHLGAWHRRVARGLELDAEAALGLLSPVQWPGDEGAGRG